MGIAVAILGGSAGAAVVAGIFGIITYKMKRKDEKADRKDKQKADALEALKKKETADIEALRKQHEEDISAIKCELALLVQGMLASLKGLQEQGCNGPVTEAVGALEDYLNRKAHR